MQRFKTTIGALAVATTVAALMLAGGTASASSRVAGKSTTGPEVISGAVHGKAALANAPKIRLKFRGLVTTHAVTVLGNNKSKTHTLKSAAGNLTVKDSSKPVATQTADKTTCRFSYTQELAFNVVGSASTGAFAGASGPGAAKVSFVGFEPRYHSGPKKGGCDGKANPRRKGAEATFLVTLVLTLP
jgi:hypothetical protein